MLVVFTARSLLFGISDTVVRDADGVYAYVNSVDGKILLSRAPYPMHRSPASAVWRFKTVHATNYRPSDPPWFDVAGLAFCHAPHRPRTYLMIPGWLTSPRPPRCRRAGSCDSRASGGDTPTAAAPPAGTTCGPARSAAPSAGRQAAGRGRGPRGAGG